MISRAVGLLVIVRDPRNTLTPASRTGTLASLAMFTRDELLRRIPGDSEEAQRARELVAEIASEMAAARHHQLALFDQAPVFMTFLEGPELRITQINQYLRNVAPRQLAIGMSARDLYRPDDPVLEVLERVYATGKAETVRDLPPFFANAARATRYFTRTYAPIRDDAGNVRGILTIGYEVTDQVEAQIAQAETEQRNREAVDAVRTKDLFLAMLGHELRNPLASMLTAIQVVRLEGVSSAAVDLLERQVRHLTRLVDDLLDISRITRGMVVLKRQPLELITVVNRALEMASPLLEQRGHRVISDFVLGDLGVLGDPDRLAQVVANLITNAAKYSEPGSQIRIAAARTGDRVILSISDAGIGISKEMLAGVFDAFVQQPQTLARSHGGLGLGLSIVKSLVEAHGGVVSAHSEGLGHGSKFVVELPALEVAASSVAAMPSTRTQPVRGRTPRRILVVDDNSEAADILKIALEYEGHAIGIAYDGPTALDLAKAEPPEIALVDIGLPVMDGYRLAELLRSAYGIPMVAVTGYGQESDRQRCLAAGFAAHLVKPVDLDALADLIDRLCADAESF